MRILGDQHPVSTSDLWNPLNIEGGLIEMIDVYLNGCARRPKCFGDDIASNLIVEEKGERRESLRLTLR